MLPGEEAAAVAGGLAAAIKIGEWTKEKVAELAKRFQERDVRFIGRESTREGVLSARNDPAYQLFEEYAPGKKYKVIVQMGIYLRKKAGDPREVNYLRGLIREKHGVDGLHLAQCVQSGVLSYVHSKLTTAGMSQDRFQSLFRSVIETPGRYIRFVNADSDPRMEAASAKSHIDDHHPSFYVVAGSGDATSVASETAENLSVALTSYEPELDRQKDDQVYLYYFFHTG